MSQGACRVLQSGYLNRSFGLVDFEDGWMDPHSSFEKDNEGQNLLQIINFRPGGHLEVIPQTQFLFFAI